MNVQETLTLNAPLRPSTCVPHFALACLLLAAGCATLAPDARENHASTYTDEIKERTDARLEENLTLTLERCIDIALENNLAIKASQVDATIARLDRNIAFADFLPQVQAKVSMTNWSDTPSSSFMGIMTMPIHDKTLREYTVDIQMPILMPSTWFVYSMRRHGVKIADLVVEQTRQAIALQVTAKYYECLSLMDVEKALESRLASSSALVEELGHLRAEGLLSGWELKHAEAGMLATQVSHREAQRALRQARAELLNALGLYPLASVTLEAAAPLAPCTSPIEDLIHQALVAHPELHVADLQTVIEEDVVKYAIAQAIPNLMGFATMLGTSDGMAMPSNNIFGGVSSVLTVFNGFANAQGYRTARQREARAYLQREERCLAIMTQVLAAHLNERTSFEYLDVAEHEMSAYRARLDEIEERWNEGMTLASERLQAIAQLDEAETRLTNMRYQHQMSVAVLRHAMGAAYTGS